MTRRAVLHLGMNKTGSSSIQKTFAGYADARWRYLRLGPPNHSAIFAVAFLDRPPPHIRNSLALDAPGLTPAEARAMIGRELARDRRSVLISAEGLAKKYWAGSAPALADFLRGQVDDLCGLAYVRDPVGFVSSVFQQVVRQQMPPDDPGALLPRYRAWFRPWAEALGRDRLALVPFAAAQFAEADLLVDFARRVGLDESFARSHPLRDNDALSAEATALLYALHHRLGTTRLEGDLLAGARRLGAVLRGFGQRKFAFSPRSLAPAVERRTADIAWVEEHMGQRFPAPDLAGRLVVDDAAALLDHAAAQGPALARHLARAGLDPAGAEADPVGALAHMLHSFAQDNRGGGAGHTATAWSTARGRSA